MFFGVTLNMIIVIQFEAKVKNQRLRLQNYLLPNYI